MQKYYSLETVNNNADLYIFGDITAWPWDEKDRDAYGIVKELREVEADTINVHINSYGGDVSEGLAIYNTLKNHKAQIVTICDGFACSAASVIFMAGDIRVINEASLLMIHNPWTRACGNAEKFRKQAEDLDKIAQASINAYMSKVNISEEKLKQLLNDETWLTAQECLDMRFATIVKTGENNNGVNQSAFAIIRNKLMAESKATEKEATKEIDIEQLADLIVKKMKAEEPQKHKEPVKESTWDSFFYGGK